MATAASIQAVQEAYIAYYGRPGDPAGIDFWAERLDAAGGNIDAMISSFGTSAEASARYASLSVTDAVNAIYNQVLGRDAEAGATGIDFYVNKVLSGEFSLVTLAQNIWDGATSGTDAQTIANKLTAANSFTQTLRDDAAANTSYSGDTAAANARTWLSGVDDDSSTVTSSVASIATTIENLDQTPTNPGSTFTLTTTATGDVFSGTARDDTFDATTSGTLQGADSLIDGSTSDSDVVNAVVATTGVAPKITNVETLNIKAKFLSGGIALDQVTGSERVVADSTLTSGSSLISGATTLSAGIIEASDNIATLNVHSAAAGTRDTVSVLMNQASGTITAGTGVDSYSVTLGSGAVVQTSGFATLDNITIMNESGVTTGTFRGEADIKTTTVDVDGDYTLKAFTELGSGVVVNTVAGQNVTIDFSGSASLLSDFIA